jgi:hypothetical protein
VHQVIAKPQSAAQGVWFRSRSCFNDDDCLAGDFDACTNMAAAGKPLFADFKLTDKKQDSENSGDDSSEPDDKPTGKSCDREPAVDGEQPSDKEPSESVTPVSKRRKAAVKDRTEPLNYSEDLLDLLSSQSLHVQTRPTDILPTTLIDKRIVYRWEEPPKWYLGTVKSATRQKLADKIFSNYMIQYDDGSSAMHKIMLEYYFDSENVFVASQSSSTPVTKRVRSQPSPHNWALVG